MTTGFLLGRVAVRIPAAGHRHSNVQLLGCAGSWCMWHKNSLEGAKENQIPFPLIPSASRSAGFVNQCNLSTLWASQITVDKENPSLSNLQPTFLEEQPPQSAGTCLPYLPFRRNSQTLVSGPVLLKDFTWPGLWFKRKIGFRQSGVGVPC